MKVYFLIKLLTLYYTSARLSLRALRDIQTTPVLETTNIFPSPTGPLNLLTMYFCDKHGFIENKRRFSSEIRASYSVDVIIEEDEHEFDDDINEELEEYTNNSRYKYRRAPKSDRIHALADTKDKKYYTTLLHMFPSSREKLRIDLKRTASFTSFLREPAVKENEHYILAALFLVSEGVDLSLAWGNDENECAETLVLIKPLSLQDGQISVESQVLCRVPMNMQKQTKHRRDSYLKGKEVINFFMAYKNKERIQEPATMQEYKSGAFLNSAQFLIQSYLFELIDTVPRAQKFIKAVYEILSSSLSDEPSTEKDEEEPRAKRRKTETVDTVFNRCFIKTKSIGERETVYVDAAEKVIETMGCDLFPFTDQSHLPDVKTVPFYNRAKKAFDEADFRRYENDVEPALYAMFCCFAYDPSTHSYSIEHMTDASPDLVQFFLDHPVPAEKTATLALHMDWAKVVSQLKPETIQYKRREERNGLESDLLNFGLVISTITGRTDIDERIFGFMKELRKETVSEDFYDRVKECFNELFTSLSINNNLKITYENLIIDSVFGRGNCVFGDITLTYKVNTKEHSITMECRWHIELVLHPCKVTYSEEDRTKLDEAKSAIENKNNFIGYILTHYIEKRTDSPRRLRETDILAPKITEITKEYGVDIDRILMLNKIEENDYKMYLLIHCLSYAKERGIKLDKNSSIFRFTSNILASVDLNNVNLARSFLSILFYTGIDKSLYKNIHLDEQQYTNLSNPQPENRKIFRAFADEKLLHGLVYLLNVFMEPSRVSELRDTALCNRELLKDIFSFLFKNNNMDLVQDILTAYETRYGKDGVIMAGLIRISWFILALKDKKEHPELIEALFDSIDMASIFAEASPPTDKHEYEYESIYRIRNDYCHSYDQWIKYIEISDLLENMKDILTRKEGNSEKYACIEHFLKCMKNKNRIITGVRWDPETKRVLVEEYKYS